MEEMNISPYRNDGWEEDNEAEKVNVRSRDTQPLDNQNKMKPKKLP